MMPRGCSVCLSPDLAEIDAALSAGASLRNIAERFGTSKSAVERHANQGHTQAAEQPPDVSGQPEEPGNLLANVMVGAGSPEAVPDDAPGPAAPVENSVVSATTSADETPRIDAETGQSAEHACPDCGAEMVPANSSNPHKAGTGWCPEHGRRPLPRPRRFEQPADWLEAAYA